MGPFRAIGRAYARMFNFWGRARRSEYWWFFLFQLLLFIGLQVGFTFYATQDPLMQRAMTDPNGVEPFLRQNPNYMHYVGYAFAASLILFFLPNLAVTIRRLHDTDRSGWFIFMPAIASFVGIVLSMILMSGAAASGNANGVMFWVIAITVIPGIAQIWFIVVLCLPGTYGNNRFGEDPAPERTRPAPSHPAFAPAMDTEATDRSEVARKAAASDYYKRHVLPNIQKPQAQ